MDLRGCYNGDGKGEGLGHKTTIDMVALVSVQRLKRGKAAAFLSSLLFKQ